MKQKNRRYQKRKTLYRMQRYYKKKRRLRLWVWIVFIILSIGIIILSIFKIFNWHNDNKNTSKQLDNIKQDITIKKIESDDSDELINPPDDKENDYWRYINLPMISVNFNELKQKNSDTVAFLKVNGTNINYPVVQTTNNDYYLHHSYDKTKNDAGWVFLDYRNDINNFQDNTIIYAHGRYDTTMFGSLKNIFKNDWYNNTENYVIHLSTPTRNTLWQVFSVYKIPTETYYLTSSFGTNESHRKFINTITSRSKYNFNTITNTNDKILTLSTCYNNKEKVVLHAKLIKIQNR